MLPNARNRFWRESQRELPFDRPIMELSAAVQAPNHCYLSAHAVYGSHVKNYISKTTGITVAT